MEIVKAVSLVKERLGVRTVLGVSNVSFGIPQRALLNSTFLAAALGCGLDFPILNPSSGALYGHGARLPRLKYAGRGRGALHRGLRECARPLHGARRHGGGAGGNPSAAAAREADRRRLPIAIPESLAHASGEIEQVVNLIMSGRKGPMGEMTEKLLASCDALDVVNGAFIPALDVVGKKFDAGEFFLPQLMASAEAVKAGFDVVREHMGESGAAIDDGARLSSRP